MCIYCDLKRKNNGNYAWRKSGENISENFYIEQEACLNTETNEEFDVCEIELVYDNYYDESASIKINYCPMCGRKLVQDES